MANDFELSKLGNYVTVNTSSNTVLFASQIVIGNSTVNNTINATSVSGVPGTNVNAQYTWTNTQTFSNTITFNSTIVGTVNNALNLGGTAAASYALTSSLSSYQTTAGLSANVATLTANNTSFVGSVSAANVVSNAQLSSNLGNYQTTAGLSGNVATLTANLANYIVANSGIVSNSSGVFVNAQTPLSSNATGVYMNTSAGNGTFTSGISALTVDAYGRVTAVTGSAGYVTSSGVTSVSTGTGLTGGPITTTGTLSLANLTASGLSGTSGISAITVDAYGRVTAVTGSAGYGTGTVTSVATGTGLSGGTITTTGTLSLNKTQVPSAWAGFNGTASTISASYNFSSLTKNGSGDYTISFSSSLTDANYAFSGAGKLSVYGNSDVPCYGYYRNTASPNSSSSFRFNTTNTGGGAEDSVVGSLMVFR